MAVPAVEAFHAWHGFYILLGTGAATLIGAMAVGLVLLLVASIRNSWDLIVFYAQRTDRPS